MASFYTSSLLKSINLYKDALSSCDPITIIDSDFGSSKLSAASKSPSPPSPPSSSSSSISSISKAKTSIQSWNNDIANYHLTSAATTSIPPPPENEVSNKEKEREEGGKEEIVVVTIEQVTIGLQEVFIGLMMDYFKLLSLSFASVSGSGSSSSSGFSTSSSNTDYNKDIPMDSSTTSNLTSIEKISKSFFEIKIDNEELKNDNHHVDDVHDHDHDYKIKKKTNNEKVSNLAMELAHQIQKYNHCITGYDIRKEDEPEWIILFESLSEVCKACKHIMKLNRALLKEEQIASRRRRKNLQQKNNEEGAVCTTSGGSGIASAGTATSSLSTICGMDSCQRLYSTGMVKLYLVLLEYNAKPLPSSSTTSNTSTSALIFVRDMFARQVCILLFHCTNYNNTTISGSVAGPIIRSSSSTMATTTSQKRLDEVITILVKLLITYSASTEMMLILIKFLHSLVGTIPGIMILIDNEVNKQSSWQDGKKGNHEEKVEEVLLGGKRDKVKSNIVSILISILAWTIRSQPPLQSTFSTTTISSHTDCRPDIASETIRVLFAIQNRHRSYYKQTTENDTQTMTQLGILIIDILHLPNTNQKIYECKTSTLILLMDAPKEYTHFLYLNQIVKPLLRLLWLQLNQVVIENEGAVQDQSSAATILPILIVLNKLCLSHAEMKRCIKDDIFPPPSSFDDGNDSAATTTSGEMKSREGSISSSSGSKSNNMSPIDAPPGTTRLKLIKLMTWTESNVKRCASELLWTLCDSDAKEFVKRTGFGNAVHMLGIRGLVNIPKSNS